MKQPFDILFIEGVSQEDGGYFISIFTLVGCVRGL